MRIQTFELKPGDVVATAKIFQNFVRSASPGARGNWRTVDDVAVQPVDRKTDDDRVVFFTDGTTAHCKRSTYWKTKEA